MRILFFLAQRQNFQIHARFDPSTLEAHRLSYTWPNEAQDGSLERENQGEHFLGGFTNKINHLLGQKSGRRSGSEF